MLDLRQLPRLIAIPSILILVAACSGYGGGTAVGSSSAGGGRYGGGDGTSSPSAAISAEPPAGGGLQIGTGTGAAGTYLTGADGMTLYVFTKDSSNTSACADACARNWPPLTVPAGTTPTAGAGVTGALTTFARADGTQQVAYGGKPLYYFTVDSAAGETNGQGVNKVWFIAQP